MPAAARVSQGWPPGAAGGKCSMGFGGQVEVVFEAGSGSGARRLGLRVEGRPDLDCFEGDEPVDELREILGFQKDRRYKKRLKARALSVILLLLIARADPAQARRLGYSASEDGKLPF